MTSTINDNRRPEDMGQGIELNAAIPNFAMWCDGMGVAPGTDTLHQYAAQLARDLAAIATIVEENGPIPRGLLRSSLAAIILIEEVQSGDPERALSATHAMDRVAQDVSSIAANIKAMADAPAPVAATHEAPAGLQ